MKDSFSVAIVGRANTGKSTIFNRIVRRKKALVSDVPRTTRDRNIARVDHFSRPFILVDTGGFEKIKGDSISARIEEQISFAIEDCDAVLFVVDGKSGITPIDREIFAEIRKLRSDFEDSVYVVVNKIDDPEKHFMRELDFHELGHTKFFSVSAEANLGIDHVIETVLGNAINVQVLQGDEELELSHLVVVGKPNVGKSSFVNRLTGDNRVIVHEASGTTRDPIDVCVNWFGRDFIFVDTAGMRRKARLMGSVEKLSVMFAERSIKRADLVLLMLDASTDASDQDIRLARQVEKSLRAMVIVVNKSDIIRERGLTKFQVKAWIREKLHFMSYAPIIFVSVRTGEGFESLFKKIIEVEKEYEKRITTSKLNKFFETQIASHQLPMRKGKRPKIYYLTQKGTSPPVFLLFCNYPELIEDSYRRYIENRLRESFNFEGAPMRLIFRSRS